MKRHGVHHLGLAATDYEGTVEFYTKVMGWEVAWQDLQEDANGNQLLRHVFFDTGDGSFVSFMCPTVENPNTPDSWATDINSGLGLRGGMYHFAFWVDSLEELEERQSELRSRGCETTEVTDHGWCSSIYFRDPNGLMLEYCATTRVFNEDDKLLKHRYQPGRKPYANQAEADRDARIQGRAPVQVEAPNELEAVPS